MGIKRLLLGLLATLPLIASQKCSSESEYYKAAVVEYAPDDPTSSLTQEQLLWLNVENYERIIMESEGMDIVVFPEYGLTSLSYARPLFQRVGTSGDNPCLEPEGASSEAIQHLSCAARAARTYVVVNIAEVVEGQDRDLFYNSALVFDRNGSIVTKYHKTHLFAESGLDAPQVPEVVSFGTDFGVTFGVFTCFDIHFEHPVQDLLARGIKHFVFPTAWIDELPYLTAIQAQMYWSSAASATLLASGYHRPAYGKLGSGIFISGRPLNYTFDPQSSTQVLSACVPKNSDVTVPSFSPEPAVSALEFYYEENLSNYTSKPLYISTSLESASACDNGFCCSLNYSYASLTTASSSSSPMPHHKLIVFNQQRRFSSPSVVKTMHIQVCSVVSCLNDTLQSCSRHAIIGQPITKADVRLNRLELNAGPFQAVPNRQPGFSALSQSFRLIPPEFFTLQQRQQQQQLQKKGEDSNIYSVKWQGAESADQEHSLQTLAIFHRVF